MKMARVPIPFAETRLNGEWQMSKAAFYLFQRNTGKVYPAYARIREIIHRAKKLRRPSSIYKDFRSRDLRI